jgi:hypothetical protein
MQPLDSPIHSKKPLAIRPIIGDALHSVARRRTCEAHFSSTECSWESKGSQNFCARAFYARHTFLWLNLRAIETHRARRSGCLHIKTPDSGLAPYRASVPTNWVHAWHALACLDLSAVETHRARRSSCLRSNVPASGRAPHRRPVSTNWVHATRQLHGD